jgi:hypothetical protein
VVDQPVVRSPPGDLELDARRAASIEATPSLRLAWMAALDRLEPKLRAATAALLAVHRMLVETWDGSDFAVYFQRADRALGVLDNGLSGLARRTGRSTWPNGGVRYP